MAGFKPQENTPTAPVNPSPPVQDYRSIAVDSKIQPRNMLLTHVEGSRWIVDYYSQLVTPDTDVAAQELNRPEVYQQYIEILQFELKVTEPLSPSVDPESSEITYVGGATIYQIAMVPNVGDMFTADIGDGRLGLFTLTAVEQRSILRDTTYAIRYELTSYLDALQKDDLQRKVTKRTHYVRDFIAIGKSPILVNSEYVTYKSLLEWIARIPPMYFAEFFNHEFKTFVIPDQNVSTYDPFLTKFVSLVFSNVKFSEYMQLNVLNVDSTDAQPVKTIWDALLERREHILDYASLKMEIQSTTSHYTRPRYAGITYSGIKLVVQPMGMTKPFGTTMAQNPTPSKPREFQRPMELGQAIYDYMLEGLLGELDGEGTPPPPPPIIHPITVDAYYVLSEQFYLKQYAATSILEKLVVQYLDRKAMNHKALLQLCETSMTWGHVERFYYLPIIYVMVLASVGDIN